MNLGPPGQSGVVLDGHRLERRQFPGCKGIGDVAEPGAQNLNPTRAEHEIQPFRA